MRITIDVDADTFAKLEATAKQEGVSVETLVSVFLAEGDNHREAKPDEAA